MTVTMTTTHDASSYFAQLTRTIHRLPLETIHDLVQVFLEAYGRSRSIFLFGNGGSAALASHMACDLGKGTAPAGGKRLRVVALTDNVALLTAWANDTRYENIFREQMENLLEAGDVAFAISGSGNSPNVLAGLEWARQAGAVTAGITGFEGGKMRALCDVCVVVPSDNMQIIEDLHMSISHAVFRLLRHRMQPTTIDAATPQARSAAASR